LHIPRRSVTPRQSNVLFRVKSPHAKPSPGNANDCAHTPRLCVEFRVSEQTACKCGGFILPNSHTDQAILGMAQIALIKAQVACKEGWAAKTVQERDDFVVFHPFPSYVMTNLPNWNTPTAQELALTCEDVLIQDIHAGTGSRMYSCTCSRND